MKLSNEQIDFIKNNEEVIFATADKNGYPRAIMVIPTFIESEKIVISNMQMVASYKNIQENPKVFITSYDKARNYSLKISGLAKYMDNGPDFDSAKDFESTRCEFIPKGIIIVKIEDFKYTKES